jgi:alpha-beta hydrolase superfamily lysophospholipase
VRSIFDRDEFNGALFFPRADTTPPPAGATDLMVEVEPGVRVHVRLHRADAARCTLLLFHGNGEVVADYDDAADRFARAGAALAVADFRGYGASDGEPTLRSAIADARPIAVAISGTLIVMGRSLGAAAAHELYADPPAGLIGVVLESAFFDLGGLVRRRGLLPPRVFDPADLAVFDPATKLARGKLPLLVLHGERDELVVLGEATAAFSAAGGADKQFAVIAGRGHNDVSGDASYWRALEAFVQRVAK